MLSAENLSQSVKVYKKKTKKKKKTTKKTINFVPSYSFAYRIYSSFQRVFKVTREHGRFLFLYCLLMQCGPNITALHSG